MSNDAGVPHVSSPKTAYFAKCLLIDMVQFATSVFFDAPVSHPVFREVGKSARQQLINDMFSHGMVSVSDRLKYKYNSVCKCTDFF